MGRGARRLAPRLLMRPGLLTLAALVTAQCFYVAFKEAGAVQVCGEQQARELNAPLNDSVVQSAGKRSSSSSPSLPELEAARSHYNDACEASAHQEHDAKAAEAQSRPRNSELPECQATAGPRDDPAFLERVRPCGNYSAMCGLPVIEANTDYPGGGVGAVIPGQDYVVQFDIGIHPVVASDILKRRLKEVESCLHCPAFEERCLEVVVKGGADWGNLGMPSVGREAYDRMGVCGFSFTARLTRTRGDIGALDCLKHDVCSAWKSVSSGRPTRGFCHDPDCGDEAAMSIFNCWRGWRLFGSLGGSRTGPFSEPVACERDPRVRGCWSHSGWFTPGRCKVFQGWDRGQGIPDPDPLRSPIQRL